MSRSNIGILSAIGNTPLVELDQLFAGNGIRFFAKLEFLNPGGSIKDRTAKLLIQSLIDAGQVTPATTIIESTSGNMGVGLAQICGLYGLKLILVVDPHINRSAAQLLKAYGAELVVVDQQDKHGGYLRSRLHKVRQLLREIPDSHWPDQYRNPLVPAAHQQTWKEIIDDLDGEAPDYLFVPTSTCGTLRGFADAIAQTRARTQVIAVDAVGSAIFSDHPAKRHIPGMGSSRKSDFLNPDQIDDVVLVSDTESVAGCLRLLRNESILVGGSSGAVVQAVSKYVGQIPKGARVVGVFPDRGERYLETIFNPSWVEGIAVTELEVAS